MDKKFETMDKKFEAVDKKLESMDKSLARCHERMNNCADVSTIHYIKLGVVERLIRETLEATERGLCRCGTTSRQAKLRDIQCMPLSITLILQRLITIY